MKLLHVIGSVNPETGGPIEGILQFHGSIESKRFGSSEIVSLDHPEAEYLRDIPFKIYPLGRSRAFYYAQKMPLIRYGYTPLLVPWLKKNVCNYDAVIVHGLWNYSIFASSRVLPRAGVPYFVYTHGFIDPWFRKRYPIKHFGKVLSWLICERRLLARADAVLFTTQAECELARNQFPAQKYQELIVHYGRCRPPAQSPEQCAAFYDLLPALKGRRYLLFLSRIHPKKGCELLVDAFAALACKNPDVDLVIAGPDQIGLQKSLAERAAVLGIADRIHWPGMVTGDAKWGAFYEAEAFVLPSHAENFGFVVAEALACGTPVLITDKVNIWHAVKNDGGGIVATDTIKSISRMLESFMAMPPEIRETMRREALSCYDKNFFIDTVIKDFFDKIGRYIARHGDIR